MIRRVLIWCVAAAVWAMPAVALTCSVHLCDATQGFLVPDGGTVPANIRALHWYPVPSEAGEDVSDEDIRVWRIDEEGFPRRVEIVVSPLGRIHEGLPGYEVRPTQLLEPYSTYRVQASLVGCEGHGGQKYLEWEFSTDGDAPFPDRLGELRVFDPDRGMAKLATAGRCEADYEIAYRHIEVDLDETARPWRALLQMETLVDDKSWRPLASGVDILPPGRSWQGAGQDMIYRVCSGPPDYSPGEPGILEGERSVRVRAHIAGWYQWLEAEPVTTSLTCSFPELEEEEEDEEDEKFESVTPEGALPADGVSRGCGQGDSSRDLSILFVSGLLAIRRRSRSQKRDAGCWIGL
ncbi:MAG: hypothetical protein ACNA8W_12250 [Bradymonadaceae bacterium]